MKGFTSVWGGGPGPGTLAYEGFYVGVRGAGTLTYEGFYIWVGVAGGRRVPAMGESKPSIPVNKNLNQNVSLFYH
jgi:hypothetical protein